MKKIISMLLLSLFCLAAPFEITNAKPASEEVKDQFHTEVKEKRELINQKIKANRKLQMQINKKSKVAADLYMYIFGEDMVSSEADMKRVETMEMELGKITEHLIHMEKVISKKIKEITNLTKAQKYDEALLTYDSIITHMGHQTDMLTKENEMLHAYIELLESLNHK